MLITSKVGSKIRPNDCNPLKKAITTPWIGRFAICLAGLWKQALQRVKTPSHQPSPELFESILSD
jgi:hypothetical protein